MAYKLIYAASAQKDLSKLGRSHAVRILKTLDSISRLPNPMLKAKKLKNFKQDTYRFRIGDYRALFRKDSKTKTLILLVILKIAHLHTKRSEVCLHPLLRLRNC